MSGESRQASPFFCVSRPPARGSPDRSSPALASRLGCAWRHSAAAAWFRHGCQLIASVEWHGAAQTCRFAPQIISSAKIIRRGSRAAETAKYCATTQTDVFVLLPPAAPHTQTHTPVPRAVHVQVLPRNEQVGATRLLTQGAPRTILRLTTLLTRKHGLCLACVAEAVQVRSQAQGVALGNVFLSKVAVRRGSRGCGAPVKPSGPQPSARLRYGGARCIVRKTQKTTIRTSRHFCSPCSRAGMSPSHPVSRREERRPRPDASWAAVRDAGTAGGLW